MASPLPPSPVGVHVRAPAKINLALKVGAPRADGYHPLATVYQAVGTVTSAPMAARAALLAALAVLTLAFAAAAGLSELGGEAEGVSFADLLHVTDLLPETLAVLAEHTGALSTHTYIDGNRQRSVSRLELR